MSNKSELEDKFDILAWWKVNSSRLLPVLAQLFPVLAQLARDVLVILVSTVASEKVFSPFGRILDDFRISHPSWCKHVSILRIGCRATPINIQKDMEQLGELEKSN